MFTMVNIFQISSDFVYLLNVLQLTHIILILRKQRFFPHF